MKFGFSKTYRLRNSSEFREVFRKRRIFSSKNIKIYIKKGYKVSRLGVIASKKVGNAANRNKAKRMVREIFRKCKNDLKSGTDIIAIPYKSFLRLKYSEAQKEMHELLQNAGLIG